jgi:hypothetical protein
MVGPHVGTGVGVAERRIELFGAFRVLADGRPVEDVAWRRRKPAALLKLLALTPTHRLLREQIIDAVWPELDATAGAANLRKALHELRRKIFGPWKEPKPYIGWCRRPRDNPARDPGAPAGSLPRLDRKG